MNRSEVLDTAKEYVMVDRAASHGDIEDNFSRIAAFWSAYLGLKDAPLNSADVAAMMVLLKVARVKGTPLHADSWVDIAGYAACGSEAADK